MTKKNLIKIAKAEIEMWHGLPPGLVLAILFAFVHRVTEGESIEETFFGGERPACDYEI